MSQLPREARQGLMRVWLEILREKHPGTNWVAVEQDSKPEKPSPATGAVAGQHELPASA